ncbi:MAG: hypothetical protein JWP87_6273 [Labilithrix sp.]|nr:hypothetical protein [Labilithrix sp.]
MGRRASEKPFGSRISRAWLAILPVLGLGAANCYSTGDGSPPPLQELYYPVGLQVSPGGTVLYAVNSDFDLQFNGGTLQSYDLALIRRHAVALIADPRDGNVPILDRDKLGNNPCPARSLSLPTLGETCAPPVDSRFYVRDTAVIGAFATDLVLSRPPSQLVPQTLRPPGEPPLCPTPALGAPAPGCPGFGARRFDRLFAPVRGNASLTWASVERDGPDSIAPQDPAAPYGPFAIQCGKDSAGRCDGGHTAGEDPDEPNNTRHLTMPGEPFGMAISEDGESILVTHQNETKTSLFSSGLTRNDADAPADAYTHPSLQFVLDGVPFGGIGLAPIPHDRDALVGVAAFPSPAFLETSRAIPEVSLLRQYADEFGGTLPPTPSSLHRPFLDRELGYPITIGAGGTDSRGIVIDPSPRIACKAKVQAAGATPGRTQADVDAELTACGQKPARAFIAQRSPASLMIGEVGGTSTAGSAYNPDQFVLHTTIPLSAGPSKVYLAPVVEADGAYALRVFAVCFDSATIFVFDPDAEQLENVIRVGLGPFAMAFDPFDMTDVATHKKVDPDARVPGTGLLRYRFAYVASFTNSFVQVLDLDNSMNRPTFERIVFTLGRPQTPKGS